MIQTRTKSRVFPVQPASPFKHKHSATPARHVPKRRRIGVTGLSVNRLSTSSDTDSNRGMSTFRNRSFAVSSPRPTVRARRYRPEPPRRNLFDELDEMSPRKRKRSEDGNVPSSSSDSWVETEEEQPDLIAEDDQHLLLQAPAYALHRLRKAELIRLWKVAGMWSTDDDDEDDTMDAGDTKLSELGKVALVNGLIKCRKQFTALESSSSLQPTSLDNPFTLRESSTSTLTSAESSEDSQLIKDIEKDVTPRARLRTRGRMGEKTSETSGPRPAFRGDNAKHKAPRDRMTTKGYNRQALRFGRTTKRSDASGFSMLRSRSSTLSSYVTTSGESDAPVSSKQLHIRSMGNPERQTPVIRRLRPRPRRTARSTDSAEVDADAEDSDNGGDVSTTNSRRRRFPETGSSGRGRKAKREALKALQHSADSLNVASPAADGASVASATLQSTPRLKNDDSPSKSSTVGPNVVPAASDLGATWAPQGAVLARTTRSGRAFGDIQERSGSANGVDDDFMDNDANDYEHDWSAEDSLEGVTSSSLIRLRRDQLVQMCEERGLEVGGSKPQLARALLEWRHERRAKLDIASTSTQGTARAPSPETVHGVGSHDHRAGEDTPVLLRTHLHGQDPATPHRSEDDPAKASENDLNLDLQELGLEDFTIKAENLLKLEKIGSGGFKDVYIGKHCGRKVAISEFRETLSEMDIRELKLLAEFRHTNIVRFRGISIPDGTAQVPCMLVSELCENGDLFDYIRNVPTPPLKRVLQLMLDIARGLEYLHLRSPAVIHRDCKSTNILINRQGVAKVGDFGLARVKHSTRSMIRSLVGTVNWQAPELWHPNPKYDYKVDVFSAALVYWEMLSGWNGEQKYPWEGHNEHYIYDAVGHKHRRPPLTGLRKKWGAEPVNLIERMWHQDPAERPTMTDVVADLEALLAECQRTGQA